jgi:adenylylsulfate kinase
MNDNVNKYQQRRDILNQDGLVIWLTGLSGSGKSTLAYELEARLLKMKKLVYVLDGDIVRTGLTSDLGFSDEDRNENVRRIAELSAILKDVSVITIVAFISPFRKMREFARSLAGKDNFIEVYVKASLETCILRDPKGLYKKALRNEIPEFTGISSVYEEPSDPDLIIDTEKLNIEESTDMIACFVMKYLTETMYVS